MQVVILAAGGGRRFADAGYTDPKPLILAHGRPMLSYALSAAHEVTVKPIVVVPWPVRTGTSWDTSARYIDVRHLQRGAALSLLAATAELDEPEAVITMDCDSIVNPDTLYKFAKWSAEAFALGHSSTIMTFTPPDDSDRYSFVRMAQTPTQDFPEVVTVAEKVRISNRATCGVHGFSSWRMLRAAVASMIANGDARHGEYYMAPVHKYVPRGTVAMHVSPAEFTCIGTPEELEAYNALQVT